MLCDVEKENRILIYRRPNSRRFYFARKSKPTPLTPLRSVELITLVMCGFFYGY